MIQLERSPSYYRSLRKFVKGDLNRAKKIKKALRYLRRDPKHPGLHLEKLQGTDTWTIRIDRANRIFLTWIDGEKVLLLDVGPHDKYSRL